MEGRVVRLGGDGGKDSEDDEEDGGKDSEDDEEAGGEDSEDDAEDCGEDSEDDSEDGGGDSEDNEEDEKRVGCRRRTTAPGRKRAEDGLGRGLAASLTGKKAARRSILEKVVCLLVCLRDDGWCFDPRKTSAAFIDKACVQACWSESPRQDLHSPEP